MERHRFDNGSVIEVSATSHDLVGFGRSVLLAVLENTTERQRSIAALETSGRIYRLLAENSTKLISTFEAHWMLLHFTGFNTDAGSPSPID